MPFPTVIRSLALAMLAVAGPPAWSGNDCDVPPPAWQPRSAVRALAERNGWQVDRLKIDDGCYQVQGRDAAGRPFKAKLDPATLQVVRLKQGEQGRSDPHHDKDRERQRPDPRPESPSPSSSGVQK